MSEACDEVGKESLSDGEDWIKSMEEWGIGSTGNGSSPTSDCCGSLKLLVGSSMECACLILTTSVPFQLPINRMLAISLPSFFTAKGAPLPSLGLDSVPAPSPAALSPSPRDLPSSLRLVHSRSSCSLGRLIYGLIGLRGIHVGFDVAFECSTGARRLRVGYYILPLSTRVSKIGVEAFAKKNCWLLEVEQLTDVYWDSEEVIMDPTPIMRYQRRMGFARDRRIGQKMAKLKLKFFGDKELDWNMPDLVVVKSWDDAVKVYSF
ncbi:hypothetical protein GIB67_002303 [Kingdonia uniflora]|uniref:Bifunctional inhibitor/plant lipid transfer protein/seed storage helical domain-containing protein n=1 Tax=Kingdonia uniflora TaxID=39325 RepID=A0A7J7KX70_9MAGN|nr:hypothetical protein GIB67_002303 [Kingdonia uniflora]